MQWVEEEQFWFQYKTAYKRLENKHMRTLAEGISPLDNEL